LLRVLGRANDVKQTRFSRGTSENFVGMFAANPHETSLVR